MDVQVEYSQIHDIVWIIVPILIGAVVYLGYKKKRQIMQWLNMPEVDRLKVLRGISLFCGVILVFYALLGPEKEMGVEKIKSEGSDIYILMDTSKSMLAEDVIPSRMERSKQIIKSIIEGLKGDRIGFIPYASSAYIQMPLTDDYDMAKMYLDVVDTDMMGGGGTDVAEAVSLAIDSFDNTDAKNPVVLILGDGEEENIKLSKIKRMIDKAHLKVFSIGIGTEEGALIPLHTDGKNAVIEYQKDKEGQPVVTHLDEETLKAMAEAGTGVYWHTDNTMSEVEKLLDTFSKLEKNETSTRQIKEYKLLYQWFLGFGILFFIISYKLPKRRASE